MNGRSSVGSAVSLARGVGGGLAAFLAGWFFAGCGRYSCKDSECDRVLPSMLSPQPSSAVVWDGTPMEIRALPVSERTPVIEPMEGVCWTGVFMSELTQPALEGMGAWPFKRYFLLLCQKDSVVMGGNVGLGDLRETPAGPFKPEIEGPFSWGTSRENYVLPYLSLSIEKAVGGAAPYPVVVSRDFQRTLLLQGKLLLSRVENGKPTDEYTPVHVSFLFNMSSADFRVEQGVFCEECLL